MGLDMYLHKKIYVGANHEFNKITGKIELYRDGKLINVNLSKVSEIVEDCGYWRKANHIHKWFVDNVQDGEDNCAEYYVSKEKLKDLLKLCKDSLENKDMAQQLLPTSSGFFFGSTDYDEYYYQDIEDTIKIIEPLIESDGDIYYHSSW